MTEVVLPKPKGITRIVYKEILPGDRKKFEAKSNTSRSGRGARDLRLSPFKKFFPIFERIFPEKDHENICTGRFSWLEGNVEKSCVASFHRPTGKRSNEGRIGSVNRCIPHEGLPSPDKGTVFLIILQRDDGSVWPFFTTAISLETDNWHPAVSEVILTCLQARRRPGVACCGYVYYVNQEIFCNGT